MLMSWTFPAHCWSESLCWVVIMKHDCLCNSNICFPQFTSLPPNKTQGIDRNLISITKLKLLKWSAISSCWVLHQIKLCSATTSLFEKQIAVSFTSQLTRVQRGYRHSFVTYVVLIDGVTGHTILGEKQQKCNQSQRVALVSSALKSITFKSLQNNSWKSKYIYKNEAIARNSPNLVLWRLETKDMTKCTSEGKTYPQSEPPHQSRLQEALCRVRAI